MMKNTIVVLGVALLMAGVVLAISGAGVAVQNEVRWVPGASTGNDTTEGGNITALNLSANSLTDKWAAYFGNVTGQIILDDDGTGNAVYTWTVTSSPSGEVCASQDASFPFASAQVGAAADIDTVWVFGSAADNAANTFTTSTCDLVFTEATVTDTATATHQGASSFETCAIDEGTAAVEDDFAFCAIINSAGTNYNGASANYEIMVPTTNATGIAGSETYWFFVELN